MQQSKNRLFNLFKHEFTVTAFYKSMDTTKEPYYIILNGVIQLRIWSIYGVLVIDEVTTLSKAYLKPIYDKIIKVLMSQDHFTVLISTITSSNILMQSCMQEKLPIVTDDRYITIPKQYYDYLTSLVTSNPNLGFTIGFYLVSVSKQANNPAIGRANQLERITTILQKDFPQVKTTTISDTTIEVVVSTSQGVSEFEIALIEQKLLIRDIHNTTMADIGFVQLSRLVLCVERFLEVSREVYYVNVRATELYRICESKNYLHVNEDSKFIHSNLFNHVHCNYGTYRVVV